MSVNYYSVLVNDALIYVMDLGSFLANYMRDL